MSIKYACTALVGTNKAGIIKPDEHGYYKLVVGALNFTNSAGIYYDYEGSRNVFESSSSFMRRIKDGCLYAEEDHPQWAGNMSLDDYVARIKRIEPKNICAHIREVEVVKENVGDNGKPVWIIYAWVKPDRERGQYLKDALDNPKQNVCFSLRALVDDKLIGGTRIRAITDLITFDWVVEPGISLAKKYNAPGLESYHSQDQGEMIIPISAIETVIARSRAANGLGMESADIYGLEQLVERERAQQASVSMRVSKPKICSAFC